MPKNPISYIMRFHARDEILARLEKEPQGTLLSAEEVEALSPEGLQEYILYENWVRMPKRAT